MLGGESVRASPGRPPLPLGEGPFSEKADVRGSRREGLGLTPERTLVCQQPRSVLVKRNVSSVSSVPRHGAEGSPPRNCDQPYADPIESDPAVSLDLQAFGWSVPASRFKKPFDGGAKVQQGPRNATDGACGRNDECYPLTSGAKVNTQRSERAQRGQRSHGDPERRDIHPTDPRSNEPAEAFWRLSAPRGMHDQCFVHTRTEN